MRVYGALLYMLYLRRICNGGMRHEEMRKNYSFSNDSLGFLCKYFGMYVQLQAL